MRASKPAEAPTVAGVFCAYGGLFFDRLAPLYLVALIAADLGVPSAAEGTVALLVGLGWAIAMPVARLTSGRWSSRRRVLVAAAGAALCGAVSAAAPGWVALVLLRGVGGVFAGTSAPAATSLVYEAAQADRRGLGLGIVQSSTRLLGSLASPAVVTAVALAAGWRAALLVSALAVVIGAVVLALLVAPQPAPASRRGPLPPLVLHPGGRRNILLSAAACVVLLFWLMTFSQSAVALLGGWLGVAPDTAGRLAAAFGLGAAAAALVIPIASDRFGRRRALAAACVLGGAGGLAAALAAATDTVLPLPVVALLLGTAGVAMGGLPLVISIVPAEAVAAGDVGRALAIPIASSELLGGAALPAAAAFAAARVGLPAVLAVGALSVVMLVGVSVALRPLDATSDVRPA